MSNFVVNLITRGCSGSKPEAVLPCDMHLEMYEDNFVCHNDGGTAAGIWYAETRDAKRPACREQ